MLAFISFPSLQLCLPFESTYCIPHRKQFVCGQFTDVPFTLHHIVFLFPFHFQNQAVFFGWLTLRTEALYSPKSWVTIYQWTQFKPQKFQACYHLHHYEHHCQCTIINCLFKPINHCHTSSELHFFLLLTPISFFQVARPNLPVISICEFHIQVMFAEESLMIKWYLYIWRMWDWFANCY